MTYDEKKDLDEKLQVSCGELLRRAREFETFAERYAKCGQHFRELHQTFDAARHKLWSAEISVTSEL